MEIGMRRGLEAPPAPALMFNALQRKAKGGESNSICAVNLELNDLYQGE